MSIVGESNRAVSSSALRDDEARIAWLEETMPGLMKRLLGADSPDSPLQQLPLAQLKLATALYTDRLEGDNAGISMGRLSERLGVRQNALTQAADRLVSHGLAERAGDPHDRRVVLLRLTSTGCALLDKRRARRRAHIRGIWMLLSAQEQEKMMTAIDFLQLAANRAEATTADHRE